MSWTKPAWCADCHDEFDAGGCACTACADCGGRVKFGSYKRCYRCNMTYRARNGSSGAQNYNADRPRPRPKTVQAPQQTQSVIDRKDTTWTKYKGKWCASTPYQVIIQDGQRITVYRRDGSSQVKTVIRYVGESFGRAVYEVRS